MTRALQYGVRDGVCATLGGSARSRRRARHGFGGRHRRACDNGFGLGGRDGCARGRIHEQHVFAAQVRCVRALDVEAQSQQWFAHGGGARYRDDAFGDAEPGARHGGQARVREARLQRNAIVRDRLVGSDGIRDRCPQRLAEPRLNRDFAEFDGAGGRCGKSSAGCDQRRQQGFSGILHDAKPRFLVRHIA